MPLVVNSIYRENSVFFVLSCYKLQILERACAGMLRIPSDDSLSCPRILLSIAMSFLSCYRVEMGSLERTSNVTEDGLAG